MYTLKYYKEQINNNNSKIKAMDKQIKKPDKSLGKSVVVKKGKITYLIGKPSFVLVKEEKKQ